MVNSLAYCLAQVAGWPRDRSGLCR